MKNWIVRKVLRLFFNKWYKIRPPEMVKYFKTKKTARAKVVHDDDGSLAMDIEGEKYRFPGFPRGFVLTGSLANLKKTVKNSVFNAAFAEIEKMAGDLKADMLPPERMCPAVRELWRVMEEMEHHEIVPDMKGRIKLLKVVICFFLQEDDAYRFRWQRAMELINIRKVKLSKADKYYARGKFWKADYDKFSY